jgi:hypothetical protein
MLAQPADPVGPMALVKLSRRWISAHRALGADAVLEQPAFIIESTRIHQTVERFEPQAEPPAFSH